MVATNIKVFKFGGASVRSAEGVKNLASIVKRYPENLVVVVSAMGKTTNALERILHGYLEGNSNFMFEYEKLKEYHLGIAAELIADRGNILYAKLDSLFGQLEAILEAKLTGSYDYCYDQIISFGELISTVIVSSYLEHVGLATSGSMCAPALSPIPPTARV
jgi:aspartate kinase